MPETNDDDTLRYFIAFQEFPNCRLSKNVGENIFQSYTGITSENTDFHVLVA